MNLFPSIVIVLESALISVSILLITKAKTKIKIEVDAASTSAKDYVEKIGGSVTVVENKKLAVKLSKKAGV